MKFDYAIGNPPYQDDRQGTSNTALPIYHLFMDAAYGVSDATEMISPARFLFNAGRTPSEWNSRMLSDTHLRVLYYEKDSNKVFANTEIKGGVAITYRDTRREFGPIGTFTAFPELNSILHKIHTNAPEYLSLARIAFVATKFNTDILFERYPEYSGRERRLSSNVFELECFSDAPRNNDDISIYGVHHGSRRVMYIEKSLIDATDSNIEKYKLLLPKADGSGDFGERLTNPEVMKPHSGFTHTFLGIGGFASKDEAQSALKYIKTKFARTLLGILKVTQDNNADKWKYVPLQDFTSSSDIDWSVSVASIDRQLYKKYDLSQDEIDFIESKVKEMV